MLIAAALAQAAVASVLAFTDGTAAVLVLLALLGCGAAVAQPAEFALIRSWPERTCGVRTRPSRRRVRSGSPSGRSSAGSSRPPEA
jgi:hypothetical protein